MILQKTVLRVSQILIYKPNPSIPYQTEKKQSEQHFSCILGLFQVELIRWYQEREERDMAYQDTFKRYEMKYLLTKQNKQRILWAMEPYMELDEYGRTTILNIYYDTPDDLLIRRSLEKPVYKEKLRLRSYGVPTSKSTVFVELKKKYQGIVYKRRTAVTQKDAENYFYYGKPFPIKDQITSEIDYFRSFYRELIPAMVISYEREAYFAKDCNTSDLRITFDENLLWRDKDLSLQSGAYGYSLLESEQTLMEIKVGGAMPLWLARKLSEVGVFQCSYSKYGSAYQQKCMMPESFLEEKRA